MPVYEYRCRSCGRRFSRLVGVVAEASGRECPHCGGTRADKLISRFARLRGDDALADPSNIGDPDDPAAVRRWVREMGKEMREDLGDEFEEALEAEQSETMNDEGEAMND